MCFHNIVCLNHTHTFNWYLLMANINQTYCSFMLGSTVVRKPLKWEVCFVWTTNVISSITQIAKFMGPTWGPPGSCRPQMGPMLAPWTLLSGYWWQQSSQQQLITLHNKDKDLPIALTRTSCQCYALWSFSYEWHECIKIHTYHSGIKAYINTSRRYIIHYFQ